MLGAGRLDSPGVSHERFALFAGTANRPLAGAVAREIGVALGECDVERFPDGEVSVRIDQSVRGCDVFIVQPTAPPVDTHVVELLFFADACRRAGAASVSAVVPYFGYARGDRRKGHRVSVAASVVAELFQVVGVRQIISVDVHSPAVEGFFRVPVDVLTAVPAICAELKARLAPDTVVVSPDLGGVRLADEYAKRLGLTVAACHKRRKSGSEVEVAMLTGEVTGRPCLIVDDMISTGATIVEAARALREAGASPEFTVAATHPVLVGDAQRALVDAGVRELVVTDTIVPPEAPVCPMRVVSVAPLIGAALKRLAAGSSLRDLY